MRSQEALLVFMCAALIWGLCQARFTYITYQECGNPDCGQPCGSSLFYGSRCTQVAEGGHFRTHDCEETDKYCISLSLFGDYDVPQRRALGAFRAHRIESRPKRGAPLLANCTGPHSSFYSVCDTCQLSLSGFGYDMLTRCDSWSAVYRFGCDARCAACNGTFNIVPDACIAVADPSGPTWLSGTSFARPVRCGTILRVRNYANSECSGPSSFNDTIPTLCQGWVGKTHSYSTSYKCENLKKKERIITVTMISCWVPD